MCLYVLLYLWGTFFEKQFVAQMYWFEINYVQENNHHCHWVFIFFDNDRQQNYSKTTDTHVTFAVNYTETVVISVIVT